MKLRFLAALCCIAAFALGIHAQQSPLTLKVMTFNLHAGHDATLQEIAELIKKEAPDFVALQEVDCYTHRKNTHHQNNRDFIAELSYYSGMMGLYCPTIKFSGGYYGIGLLTRHPYIHVDNIMLPNPNPEMEQRAILEATIVMPQGDTIVMASTHLEAFDANCRAAQGDFIKSHYNVTHYPTILAGDFNSKPQDSVIANIMNRYWLDCTNEQFTFSSYKPEEKIDYIFITPKDQWQVTETHVIECRLSDHFPVVSTIEKRN